MGKWLWGRAWAWCYCSAPASILLALDTCLHGVRGAAMPRQGPGVLKAMMLLSPPPRGHCKRWGQTGSQTLGKGSRKLGRNPKVLHRGREVREAGQLKKAPPNPTVPVQPHLGALCLMSRNLSNPGSGPHTDEQVGRGGGGEECLGQTLTLADTGAGPGGGAAKAAGGCTVADHVLLWLEKDDVQLGCEETSEHHRATEAD